MRKCDFCQAPVSKDYSNCPRWCPFYESLFCVEAAKECRVFHAGDWDNNRRKSGVRSGKVKIFPNLPPASTEPETSKSEEDTVDNSLEDTADNK